MKLSHVDPCQKLLDDLKKAGAQGNILSAVARLVYVVGLIFEVPCRRLLRIILASPGEWQRKNPCGYINI